MGIDPQTLVVLDDVVVERGGHLAVDRVSLAVCAQEIVALVGPSGCGKTSLLRAIAGLERCVSGTVQIADHMVNSRTRWIPPEQRSVGLVFQEGALFPHMTVRDNVRFGVRGQPDEQERVSRVLELAKSVSVHLRSDHKER